MIRNKEVWKDIEGYEGIYKISSLGRVKSLSRLLYNGSGYFKTKDKIRALVPDKDGYNTVMLYGEDGLKNEKVHRLVAQAFIPNPNNYPLINHINENKGDNNVDNLEWCSHSYNVTYGTHEHRLSKLRTPVKQFTMSGKLVNEYPSIACAVKLGYNQSNISRCCSGERKSHKGYIWRYADEELS